MSKLKPAIALALSAVLATPPGAFASSHREAPITALDHKADITDFYAFVSYDHPDRVTFIMNVDPFLEPSNGPNYFPFDPSILYEIKIDNNQDALADVTFQFRFQTHVRAPGVPVGLVGAGKGVDAPSNSPKPVKPGTPIVPPAITSLTGAGAAGFSLQQTYSVNMIRHGRSTSLTNSEGGALIAVPSNVGPRTMPDYDALAAQGIFDLKGNSASDVRVFAGTVADPFFIDLGATFDSLNYRAGKGVEALTKTQDGNDQLSLGAKLRLRLQREHNRDRSTDHNAHQRWRNAQGHRHASHHRSMGHDLAAATHGSAVARSRERLWKLLPGAASGESTDQ